MYWQNLQTPEAVQIEEPDSFAEDTTPEFPLKLDASPAQPPLPDLNESDAFVADTINTLLANESLMAVFINERLIQKIVTTIDNLPSNKLPLEVMPIHTATGSFITSGTGKNLVISPENAERYLPYMNLVDAVDSKQLVQLYVRLYPLLQQAYEELGYPDKYFNDRLIFVIDHLLAAPDVKEPVKLVQPLVVHKFADANLEARSIGQRIMMRIWHILLLSLFSGLINAFDMPTRQSFVIDMVDDRNDLPNAIALNSSVFNAARLVGPTLAGLLITVVGEGMCFLVNAISYIAVIVSLLLMNISPKINNQRNGKVLAGLKEGIKYAYNFKPILVHCYY